MAWGALSALGVGCTPTAFLGPKENLLYRVELEGVRRADPLALAGFFQQKPLTTLPLVGGTPKLWFWEQGRKVFKPEKNQRKLAKLDERFDARIRAAAGDSFQVAALFDRREKRRKNLALRTEKGNFLMRKLGEPPVIYDSLKTVKTLDQLQIYLAARGFFRARATARTHIKDRKLTLTYQVTEGPEATVTALHDSIADPVVARLVTRDRDSLGALREDGRLLRLGDRYDADVLGRERERLEAMLKNRGYYEFRQQYVSFVADTTNPAAVRVTTVIANPPGARHHPVYRLRQVTVITDADRVRFGLRRDTVRYLDSVRYLAYVPYIRPSALSRKMPLRSQQLYSPQRADRAQRQLSSLDLFRFVNVTFRKAPVPADSTRRDSAAGGVPQRQLDALVGLAPLRKYQETVEGGVSQSARLFGPVGSARLRVRNIFQGGELLDLGLRGAYEGQQRFSNLSTGSSQQGIYALSLGGDVGLVYPRVLLAPLRFDRRMAPYNPRTRLTVAYTYVRRDEYTRTNLEFTYDYVWQRSRNLQYIFTPFDISLINVPRTNADFQAQLDRFAALGFPLNRSFQSQLVPSINFQRVHNSNDFAQTLDAGYSRLLVEVGGLSNLLLHYDRLTEGQFNLPVYSFARIALDVRRYWKLGPKRFVVGRLNTGAVKSLEGGSNAANSLLGFGNGVLPYDKFFFAGGPSSLRGWKPRRLGPGTYRQPDQTRDDGTVLRDVVEQPGELLFEANLEYRTPLFGFFNGAAFIDAGNVWALSETGRPGAKFNPRTFYRELAVDVGLGLRFDFTFLVLRLDVGVKTFDPTETEGSQFVLGKIGRTNQQAFNLGIGYPF